jgi:hypothetical protein
MSPADADNAVTYAVLIVLAIVVAVGLALWAHANASARHDHWQESGRE